MKKLEFTKEDGFYVAEVDTNGEPIAVQVNRKYFPYPHDYSLEVLGRIDPSMPWAPVQMFDYKSPRNIIVYQNIPVDGYQLKLRSRTEVETAATSITDIDYLWLEAVEDNCYIGYFEHAGYLNFIEFSKDKKHWKKFEFESNGGYSIQWILLRKGERVYFRGDNPDGIGEWAEGPTSYFALDGYFTCGGKLNTLSNMTGDEMDLSESHYEGIFSGLYNEGCIVSAENLILPKQIAECSLSSLLSYNDCLLYAPIIDIDNILDVDSSISRIFEGCIALEEVTVTFTEWPEDGFYYWMSEGSSSGTFYCPEELDTSIRDEHHIPEGWIIERL